MNRELSSAQIAWRAAQDIQPGAYVNLGIGFPEKVAQFTQGGDPPVFHTENGLLGFGPAPLEGEEDWDCINAGKKAVTLKPGAAFFDHATSFAMVRGGHLDLAILGAYEVAQNGDLANWSTGSDGVPAVGGAMDLVHGAKQVVVLTKHNARDGSPKLVDRCNLPLTGAGCISRVYSSLGVFEVDEDAFVVREIIEGISVAELKTRTSGRVESDETTVILKVPEDVA